MGQITKRSYKLADGREIIYFDDADTDARPRAGAGSARAGRPRPPTATMRQDVLTGEWISIAAARQNRVVLPPVAPGPAGPGVAGQPLGDPEPLRRRRLREQVPVVRPGAGGRRTRRRASTTSARLGLGRSRQSVGRCEVVCFSPEHTGSLGGLPLSRMRTVVEAWADRTAALSALPGVEQVFPFENRGEAIGVTLHHPHGQIYAYPYITPRTAQLVRSIESYGGPLFEDILELRAEVRAGACSRASTGPRSCRSPRAGRWRCTCCRTGTSPTSPPRPTRNATSSPCCTCRLLRGVDALYDTPTPVHRGVAPGARPRAPGRHPAACCS